MVHVAPVPGLACPRASLQSSTVAELKAADAPMKLASRRPDKAKKLLPASCTLYSLRPTTAEQLHDMSAALSLLCCLGQAIRAIRGMRSLRSFRVLRHFQSFRMLLTGFLGTIFTLAAAGRHETERSSSVALRGLGLLCCGPNSLTSEPQACILMIFLTDLTFGIISVDIIGHALTQETFLSRMLSA